MDERAISAYDAAPPQFAADWRDQPAPTDLYPLLRRDRHTPACFRRRRLGRAAAPALDACENVRRETVVMNLDAHEVGPTTHRLLDLLRPGGTLLLS